MSTLTYVLKHLMEHEAINQHTLAERCGVSVQHVNDIIHARRVPAMVLARRMTRHLHDESHRLIDALLLDRLEYFGATPLEIRHFAEHLDEPCVD